MQPTPITVALAESQQAARTSRRRPAGRIVRPLRPKAA